MNQPRYLTKSRFKLACECPTKLFYTNKKDVYADQNLDDPFLRALADGGFQVGELAKHYFPGGTEIGRIGDGDYRVPVDETRKLIESGDVTLYEAAFQADDYFIYADIVERRGGNIFLYEVKAKSIDPSKYDFVTTRRPIKLHSDWETYLLDVAFQKMVVQKAFPEFGVQAHLVLVDKSSTSPTDGLNQKFRIKRDGDGRMEVVCVPLTQDDLSSKLLCTINVDLVCDQVFSGELYQGPLDLSFAGTAAAFADHYARDEKFAPHPSKACRDCEFQAGPEELARGLKSGFRECWSEQFGWSDDEFSRQSILNLWNFKTKDKLIGEGRVALTSVTQDDLNMKPDGNPGLTRTDRQWKQIEQELSGENEPYLDRAGLRNEMEKWTFPLHFIDFETSSPAIPFTKGRRPYEGIAFQFSHHAVFADGTIEHKGEYLNAKPGAFPSFDFLRKLRDELTRDTGTIFQYSPFENTYLNHIFRQLLASDVHDRSELMDFIKEISRSNDRTVSETGESWVGARNMVDMLYLVKRYHLDPQTRGSNSIKHFLPAILNRSDYLKKKYSSPIYGSATGIKSLNFTDRVWVVFENEKVADPYKCLPKMFEDISDKDFEALMSSEDEIRDGGAALTAYAKLQFQEMSDYERRELESALLRYCELDTLAMVMIYEGWREMLAE